MAAVRGTMRMRSLDREACRPERAASQGVKLSSLALPERLIRTLPTVFGVLDGWA
jgi:hypothetical protein